MSDAEGGKQSTAFEKLRAELGLPLLPSLPETATFLSLNAGGQEISVLVPHAAKRAYRQKLNELARRERRQAANAGNAANTSQLIGGGIGGTLAAGGLIALATATSPLSLAAVLLTGAGTVVAVVGLVVGHRMNKKKIAHEEKMDRYLELSEEMK